MTLNNPPDQPSVEQITTKNNFSYTSHDHHPLTGTPFPENNTAIPTTLATLATLTTPASDPAANLASSPAILATPTTLTTLATTDHPNSNFPPPLTTLEHTTLPSVVTLSAAKGLSPWAERCFAVAQHDSAIPYYCALAIEPYGRHVPVYDTLNISLKFIKVGSTMMPSPGCRILSRGEIWEEFCNVLNWNKTRQQNA